VQLPPSFAEIIKGMSTEDLKEMLEWNSASSCNNLVNELVEQELNNREG